MCYSTRQTRKKKELQFWANVKVLVGDIPDDLELIYFHANGWNHPIMWTITQENPDALSPAMWGIMPSKKNQSEYKEHFSNHKTFGGLNAKSESLFDHFIYRYSWESQRCLIPVDGFFEPHHTHPGDKKNNVSVPFYFSRKDQDPLFLAGIYTNTADGRRTFAVLTKEATPLFKKIHNTKNRRPVIIDYENKDEWLYEGITEDDVQNLMDEDLWEGDLDVWPISRNLYSRSVDSNYPDIIEKEEHPAISIEY